MAKSSFRDLSDPRNTRKKVQELTNKIKESRANELSLDSNIPSIENLEDEEQKALEKKLKEEEEKQRKEEEELKRREELEKKKEEEKQKEENIEQEDKLASAWLYEKEDNKDRAGGVKSLSEFAEEDMKYDRNKTYEEQFNEWSKDKATTKFKSFIDFWNLLSDKYRSKNTESGNKRKTFWESMKSGELETDTLKLLGLWSSYGLSEIGQSINRGWRSLRADKLSAEGLTIDYNDTTRTHDPQKREDYYKYFLDKANYRAYSEEETDWGNRFMKKQEENLSTQDKGDEADLNEITKLYEDNKELFDSTEKFVQTYVSCDEALTDLFQKLSKAEDDGDTEKATLIQEEIDVWQTKYFKEYYEFGLGVDISGSTIKEMSLDIQKKLKQKTGKTYGLNDIKTYNVPLTENKYNLAAERWNTITDLVIKYNMRDDARVTQLPIDTYLDTFESYGVLLGQDDKDKIIGAWSGLYDELKVYDQRIKLAQDKGDSELVDKLRQEKQNKLIGISWYNSYLDSIIDQVTRAGGEKNLEEITPTLLNIFESDELRAVKELVTDENVIAKYQNKETGVIDYVAWGNYLRKSNQIQDLGAYALGEKAVARVISRQIDIDQAKTKVGEGYYKVKKWGYEMLGAPQGSKYQESKYLEAYLKYRENGGNDIIDDSDPNFEFTDEYVREILESKYDYSGMDKYKQGIRGLITTAGEEGAKDIVGKKLKQSRRRGDDITDSVTKAIMNMDPERGQSYRKQWGDVIETVGDKIQAYPGDVAMTVGSIAIPFLGTADKIAAAVGGANALNKTTSFGRFIYNFGPKIFGEVVEGQLMNMMFDNTNYGHAEPVWDLFDVAGGTFKSLLYLSKYKTLDKFLSTANLDVLLESLEKKYGKNFKLSMLTDEDRLLLNKKFILDGLGGIVEKPFTDYLQESKGGKLSIDKQQLYKDYSASWQKFFGIEGANRNNTIWKKILNANLKTELNTFNEETIEELYRRATKAVKNDEVLADVLKRSGKKGVIRYRLTSELNSLKKIGQTKLGALTLSLMEAAGNVNQGVNEEFTKLISQLKRGRELATTQQQIEFFDEAIKDATDLWSQRRLLPLQLSETTFGEALNLHKINTEEFNKKYAALISDSNIIEKNTALIDDAGNVKTVEEGGVSGISDKIIELRNLGEENGGGMQKIAELIMGDTAKFEEYGGKVYNVQDYVDAIKNSSDSLLTEGQISRLESLLNVLDSVNKGIINIIELPDEIKKSIKGLQGFMGYLKKGERQGMIISLASGLIGGVKNFKFDNTNALIHELGHAIFFSLSKGVQSKLVGSVIDLIDGKDIGPALFEKLGIKGKARFTELQKLHKDGENVELVEEIVADMLGNSIAKGIQGDENMAATIGQNIINQMAKGKKITDPVKTGQPFDLLGNKFVDMLTSLYNAMGTERQYEELQGIMYYIAANISEGKRIKKPATKGKVGKTTVFGRGGEFEYVPSGNFFPLKETTAKADLNVMKNEGAKIATLTQGVSSFDVAGVYSNVVVKKILNDSTVSVEQLGQLLSTKWFDFTTISDVLKGADEGTQTKFLQAMEFAQQRQEVLVSNLLKFWKNGEIDLSKKIDGYSFADILNSIATKITKDGYVDFAGIDFTKFINGSDKNLYNKIFTDYMKYIASEYDPDVIADISRKLKEAGIEGNGIAEQRVDFANKVQDTLYNKAVNGGIDKDTAKMLSEDICSRLFAGSFYYMSNINQIEEGVDLINLVDDLAYGLLLKNKGQARADSYLTLYDIIEKEFLKEEKTAYTFSENLVDLSGVKYGESMKGSNGIDPSDFRHLWYGRGVFNILAARGEEYFISMLRKLGEDGQKIKLSNVNWGTFVSGITQGKSLTKTMISELVVKFGFDDALLKISSTKLREAHTLNEVCDVYISALKNKRNTKLIGKEVDRDELISQLEKLKSEGFNEQDYNKYLADLEKKYLVNAQDGLKLDDYIRSVLSTDDIKRINIEKRGALRGLMEPVPSTLPKEFKESVESIDSALSEPEVQEGITKLTELLNDWSNTVMEYEGGNVADVAKIMLSNELYKPYFDIAVGEKGKLANLKVELTNSSYSKIQQIVVNVSSEEYKKQGNWLTKQIGRYANLTTVGAAHRDIGAILTKGIDFVNGKKLYVTVGNIADFLKLKKINPKGDWLTVRAVVNEIISTLNKAIRDGVELTPSVIKDDIVRAYTRRYHTATMISNGEEVSKTVKFKKYADEKKIITAEINNDSLMHEYEAAINAYVDVLAARHSTMGEFTDTQLSEVLGKFLGDEGYHSRLISTKKANLASQLLGLNGYWLGVSYNELSKLKKFAAVWNPALFQNYLYNTFKHTNKKFGTLDWVGGILRGTESTLADLMFAAFYTIPSGAPAAMQQVVTNFTEIFAKTLGELGFEDVDPQTVNEVINIVGDLMPSEIISVNRGKIKVGTRTELDVASSTSILGNGINKILSALSALSYADKGAEHMVKRYALASSLIAQGFNGASLKELTSSIVAKMADYGKSGLEDLIDFDDLLKLDATNVEKTLNYKIGQLVKDKKLTNIQGMELKKYGMDLNEMMEPFRRAAKQANYKKNAFFQMSQVPELTQNLLAGERGVANMRFFNWGSRKAGEYAFNIADAIMREDTQQLQKYIAGLLYRGYIGTRIFAQIDKATTNLNGIDKLSFWKVVLLPLTVLDMAMYNAIDIVRELCQASDRPASDKKYADAVASAVFNWGGNLKNRLYTAPLYWAKEILAQYNGRKLLNEKVAGTDYVSGLQGSLPIVSDLLNALKKTFFGRLTNYRKRTTGGIFKDNPGRPFETGLMDMIFGSKITNAAQDEQDVVDLGNELMYGDENKFSGEVALTIVGYSRDSSQAYKTVIKRFQDKGLDRYFLGGSYLKGMQEEFDILSKKSSIATTLTQQGFDGDLYNDLVDELFEGEDVDAKRAKSVLALAAMKSSKMQGFLEAGEGLTKEERDNFIKHVKQLVSEIQEDIEKAKKKNPSSLKNAAYDIEGIEKMVDKYANIYGEEMIIAAYISAMVTDYKTDLRKYIKKVYGDSYQEKLYGDSGINHIIQYGGTLANGEKYIGADEMLNKLVVQFYPTLIQGNEMIPNTMMYLHGSLMDDYPLNSPISLASSFGAQIDDYFMLKNYENRGYGNSGIGTLGAFMVKKVLNSNDVTWEEKVDYIDKMVDYADLQGPFVSNVIKAGLTPILLSKYEQINNTDPDFWERNSDWVEREFKKLTVSQPLTDEAIKEEVKKSIFKKQTSSGSGKKGRKGSISFDDLADNLTKFQAFKRQFEEMVLNQEPLNRIAYKATSHGVTPIQLSIGEAHEIDQKYTFIIPKQPESEKTPDIVVKQVKTSSSKYSGKAIKQSNVYKVKKIL